MIALILFVLGILASPFKAKSRLEAENAALRQQLIVLRRKVKSRPRLANTDRWFFVQLYRWFPSILDVLTIIRPETLVRWHRAGFRRYWHWKSRRRGGRPQVQSELRALIRQMSVDNPLWGAPRIHGELLKLGFEVSQSSVAKYGSGANFRNQLNETLWSIRAGPEKSESVRDSRIGRIMIHHVGWKGGRHGWQNPIRRIYVTA